jgi:hypothetical protein
MSDTHALYNALHITNSDVVSFVDINLSKDTRLFIDPINILKNSDALSIEATEIIQNYFTLLIEYISE